MKTKRNRITDKARLDWLNNQRGHVRGTDFPVWYVEGKIEDRNHGDAPDTLTVRQAIDEAMKGEEKA